MHLLFISLTRYFTIQTKYTYIFRPAHVAKCKVVIYGEGKVRETGRKKEERNNEGGRKMKEYEREKYTPLLNLARL